MRKEVSIRKIVAYLMMMFLSWGDFQIGGLYFFILLQILFCICSFVAKNGKFYISKNKIVNIIYVTLFLSTISSFFADIPDSFRAYAVAMCFALIPTYFTLMYISNDIKKDSEFLYGLLRWMKLGFLVQIIYLPIQYFFYKIMFIDLNKIIFSDILGIMHNPTFFRQGQFYPSGFVWHSALLAPVFVLSALMIKNSFVKIIILVDAFICGNVTVLMGVLMVYVFMWLYSTVYTSFGKVGKKRIIEILSVFALGALIVVGTNVVQQVIERMNYIIYRMSVASMDSSSQAHLGYYLLFPKIIKNMNVTSLLFGTGYSTSGYAITEINGQYAGLLHWAVESDYIDMIISRGVVGFLAYLSMLIYIAIKGRKISYKYVVVVLVMLVQGITYNIQFEYVFFIELIMLVAIKTNINIFEVKKCNKDKDD